ncbi:hypothetical protein ANN_18715 [Periplaneta americana]|uniref:Protein kinase domain-containing protein n=1 Tax=Periplaneta americana TaxID=6978 RepID=A0ABQ8SQ02_PERAM|nr:hypothetical protein ANN_18715 [Periplaneta americana]
MLDMPNFVTHQTECALGSSTQRQIMNNLSTVFETTEYRSSGSSGSSGASTHHTNLVVSRESYGTNSLPSTDMNEVMLHRRVGHLDQGRGNIEVLQEDLVSQEMSVEHNRQAEHSDNAHANAGSSFKSGYFYEKEIVWKSIDLDLQLEQPIVSRVTEQQNCKKKLVRTEENAIDVPETVQALAFMDIKKGYLVQNGSIMITDFSDHGDLLSVINTIRQEMPIPETLMLYWMVELLNIAEKLQECKIIHGDIKPDNFILRTLPSLERGEPSLQLIDMGRGIDMTLFPPNTTFKTVVTTKSFQCIEMQTGRPWTYQDHEKDKDMNDKDHNKDYDMNHGKENDKEHNTDHNKKHDKDYDRDHGRPKDQDMKHDKLQNKNHNMDHDKDHDKDEDKDHGVNCDKHHEKHHGENSKERTKGCNKDKDHDKDHNMDHDKHHDKDHMDHDKHHDSDHDKDHNMENDKYHDKDHIKDKSHERTTKDCQRDHYKDHDNDYDRDHKDHNCDKNYENDKDHNEDHDMGHDKHHENDHKRCHDKDHKEQDWDKNYAIDKDHNRTMTITKTGTTIKITMRTTIRTMIKTTNT